MKDWNEHKGEVRPWNLSLPTPCGSPSRYVRVHFCKPKLSQSFFFLQKKPSMVWSESLQDFYFSQFYSIWNIRRRCGKNNHIVGILILDGFYINLVIMIFFLGLGLFFLFFSFILLTYIVNLQWCDYWLSLQAWQETWLACNNLKQSPQFLLIFLQLSITHGLKYPVANSPKNHGSKS
jgi:hypothetical protein